MFNRFQEIIAIKDHPQHVFKRGDIYRVLGVRRCGCRCHDFLVHIGYTSKCDRQRCGTCETEFFHGDKISWVGNRYFVPLEMAYAEIVLEKVMKEEGELVKS